MQTKFTAISILVILLSFVRPCLAMLPAEEQTVEFQKYHTVLKQMVDRNLSQSVLRQKPVTIRFFLTSDGFIYDVTVYKSSGDSTVDLACIDAVCSASPLPAPPELRLAPPTVERGGKLIPPRYFSTGIHYFYFPQNYFPLRTPQKLVEPLSFRVIPNEVIYRYPGLFSAEELASKSNQVIPYPKETIVEDTRFQWARFFQAHKTATKSDIADLAKNIKKFYLDEETAVRF